MQTLINDIEALSTAEQVAFCLILLEIVLEEDFLGSPIHSGLDVALDKAWDILRGVPTDLEVAYFEELWNSEDTSGYWYLATTNRTPANRTARFLTGECFLALGTATLSDAALLRGHDPTDPDPATAITYVVNVKGVSVTDLTAVKNSVTLSTVTRPLAVTALNAQGLP